MPRLVRANLAIVLLGLSLNALAAVPTAVPVAGLLQSSGGPVVDGEYIVTLQLYGQEKGGASAWKEGPTIAAVKNGQFALELGNQTPLSASLLGSLPQAWLGITVGLEPELPRRPLGSVPFALRALQAEGLDCSGCVGAQQLDPKVLQGYAKTLDLQGLASKTELADYAKAAALADYVKATALAKVASSGAYADLSGTPDLSGFAQAVQLAKVASSGAYADLSGTPDLSGFAQTAKLANVALSGSFNDLANVPALAKLGTACGTGLVVKGLKADGSLDCTAGGSLAADGLGQVSNGLLVNTFVDKLSSTTTPVEVPDNNPVGIDNTIDVADLGNAQGLSIQVDLSNSDIGSVKVMLYDPNNAAYTLYDKGGKGTGLVGSWPDKNAVVAGDLGAWLGKNPKGKWRLQVIDSGFTNNAKDGKLNSWSVTVNTLSGKKVRATGLFQLADSTSPPAPCNDSNFGAFYASSKDKAFYVCNGIEYVPFQLLPVGTQSNPGASCKDILAKQPGSKDGLYWLAPGGQAAYQAYCDMTTDGGGWTLISSVHEDNISAKCNIGDKWSSTTGNNSGKPKGDGNWENTATFGATADATKADYKGAAYFALSASNVMLWHVPNGTALADWRGAALLRYYTTSNFLNLYGGSLYTLFKDFYPNGTGGNCGSTGPSPAVTFDKGNAGTVDGLIAPNSVGESDPGFIHFRVYNNEKASFAVCPGIKYTGCNSEHACIGSSGWVPEGDPAQCGDFGGWDWPNGYGTGQGWSATKAMTDAAVLFFVR